MKHLKESTGRTNALTMVEVLIHEVLGRALDRLTEGFGSFGNLSIFGIFCHSAKGRNAYGGYGVITSRTLD